MFASDTFEPIHSHWSCLQIYALYKSGGLGRVKTRTKALVYICHTERPMMRTDLCLGQILWIVFGKQERHSTYGANPEYFTGLAGATLRPRRHKPSTHIRTAWAGFRGDRRCKHRHTAKTVLKKSCLLIPPNLNNTNRCCTYCKISAKETTEARLQRQP